MNLKPRSSEEDDLPALPCITWPYSPLKIWGQIDPSPKVYLCLGLICTTEEESHSICHIQCSEYQYVMISDTSFTLRNFLQISCLNKEVTQTILLFCTPFDTLRNFSLNPIENSEFIPFIISSIHRITFASYPNKAMFGKDFKGREVCKVVRKLLKICHGWLDPDKLNSFGDYGDGLKLKKPVLEREFPR